MIIGTFIFGIIIILLGFVVLYYGVANEVYTMPTITFIAIIILGGTVIHSAFNPIPTKQDVLDGKAVYEETITIHKGDSIKTYEIVWKE